MQQAVQDRWRASAWLLWRPGKTTTAELASIGRLGASQAGMRLDFDLTQSVNSRIAAYGRVTTALERPRAPEAALGLSYQPVRTIPVSFAIERRVALDDQARNAMSLMLVGGFGPTPVAGSITATGYAQAGMVGLRSRDLFIDGRLALFAPLPHPPVHIGGSISGGAQPQVERLDIGPAAQIRLPLQNVAARIDIEWRQRIAGHAAPASGLAFTLAADF